MERLLKSYLRKNRKRQAIDFDEVTLIKRVSA